MTNFRIDHCSVNSSHMDMQEALRAIQTLSAKDVVAAMAREAIGPMRSALLLDVLKGQAGVHSIPALEIQLFAIKALLPDLYAALPDRGHSYASGELYEYDPVKSGKNIIKHGVSFSEVVSYSRNFGALSVPYPHSPDEDRVVLFSGLNAGSKGRNLALPYPHIDGLVYTLTIAQSKPDFRYRFISSRIIDHNDYRRDMTQAFRDIPMNTLNEKKVKQNFMDMCEDILERNLFGSA